MKSKIDFLQTVKNAIEAANLAGDKYIEENPNWQRDLCGGCVIKIKGNGNGLVSWLKKNLPGAVKGDRLSLNRWIKYREVQQITMRCECTSAAMYALEAAGIEGLELSEWMD